MAMTALSALTCCTGGSEGADRGIEAATAAALVRARQAGRQGILASYETVTFERLVLSAMLEVYVVLSATSFSTQQSHPTSASCEHTAVPTPREYPN